MMNSRKITDHFFRYLVRAVALVSVLALGAIVFFVFFQGTRTFFTATAPGLQLVQRNLNDIRVYAGQFPDRLENVDLPEDLLEGIGLPEWANHVRVSFTLAGETEVLEFTFDASERDPERSIAFIRNEHGRVTYPQAYVFTVDWSDEDVSPIARWLGLAAPEATLNIIIPEPPYNFFAFLTGREWRPTILKLYGILPMIVTSVMAALGAILLGVPLALLCAVFMAEFLPTRFASMVRSGVELLAGIPSVVFGFFGLMVIVPAVRQIFDIPAGNTLLSATVVLSLMILPTVTTIAETSLRAVPRSVREASLALGASKMQTAWRVVLPHANSGVIAGIILGMSRAVGETMAVILVAGNSPQLTVNPLESVRTLTATIALEMGYASGRHSEMLFSIGVVLFSMILILNSAILAMRRSMERA